MAGNWSQAGAMPQDRWPTDNESVEHILAKWDKDVGDARQEFVIIGMDMDEAALRARFDACLLTDQEMALARKAG